jgi:tRNA(Ile)-lysidine synthase
MTELPLLKECRAWLDTASLPEPLPLQLAVGWSGGADSTALLLALAGAGYDVHAWHVDHAWHEHSAEQSMQLARQATAWGVPFSSVRLTTAAGSNREAVARSGRYEAFGKLSREQGITALCLAHHRDDQAETVFMRMLQGAGVDGCQGMRSVREHGGLKIFRPFLHISCRELKASLRQAGVEWLEDASNRDITLWRNKIRHHLFPSMERYGTNPSELFLRWRQQARILSSVIEQGIRDVQLHVDDDCCSLPWDQWRLLAPPMRVKLMKKMMRTLFGEAAVPGRRHILLIENWMRQGGSGGLDLSRSRIMRKDGRLCLVRKA